MPVEVRRVRTDEWETLRDLRIAALADAPTAFGTTRAEALARPDEWWVEWARASAESDTQAMVIAWDGAGPAGLAGVFEHEGRWQVISMWVDPSRRGSGAGRLLLDAVVAFARERGADTAYLSVTDGNDAARALYERYGFVDTGEHEPLRSHPDLVVREMRL